MPATMGSLFSARSRAERLIAGGRVVLAVDGRLELILYAQKHKLI